MKQKLITLQNNLNQHVIGREPVIKSALLSLVAGENILLIGPPGTAKSMIARSIAQVIQTEQNNNYFEYLLTKFSTPEEIFGPLSISELKQDRFKRNTDGYLPTVQVAFLDEIFKASSSILNALLTILNERKYHNGTHTIDTPLISIISASNELPTGQAELSALYDRFLIRSYVDYLPNEGLSELFNFNNSVKSIEKLTHSDLRQIRYDADGILFPKDVQQAILQIWQAVKDEFKDNTDESLSDRRFVKCLHLMRISAATNDRTEVDFSDVFLLKDCLWNVPENAEEVVQVIKNVLQEYNTADNSNEVKATEQNSSSYSTGVTLKGFKGSGTKRDPFLIEDIYHLQDLANLEIGQQGHHFKQINDIDCTIIDEESCFDIDLVGHYNGNGKNIIYNNSEEFLFNSIDGSIQNLTVLGLQLAKQVQNSTITNCHGNIFLFQNIKQSKISYCSSGDTFAHSIDDSQIEFCQIGRHLATEVYNSHIQYCHAKSILILSNMNKTTIEDCQINIEETIDDLLVRTSGIVNELGDDSHIKRCYVDGNPNMSLDTPRDYFHFFGIVCDTTDNNSSIEYCAIGKINTQSCLTGNRIIDRNNIDLVHNISIDSNRWGVGKKADKNSGKTVNCTSFNQNYFESELGWDFKNTWQWNMKENRPELMPHVFQAFQSDNYNITQFNHSLLKQFKDNIWI